MVPAEMMEARGELAMGTKPFQGIPSIAVSKSGKRVFLAPKQNVPETTLWWRTETEINGKIKLIWL